MRRDVITGLGIWSCLGTTLAEVRDALYAGKSGIVMDPVCKEMGYRAGLTGQNCGMHGVLGVSETTLVTCREILGEETLNQIIPR